jgi:hypothetical protein
MISTSWVQPTILILNSPASPLGPLFAQALLYHMVSGMQEHFHNILCHIRIKNYILCFSTKFDGQEHGMVGCGFHNDRTQ